MYLNDPKCAYDMGIFTFTIRTRHINVEHGFLFLCANDNEEIQSEREGHEDIVHRKSYLHNGKYIVRLCGTMSGNRELDR